MHTELQDHAAPSLLLINEVLRLVRKTSKASIYNMVRRGELPPPRKCGQTPVWVADELYEHLRNLPVAAIKGAER